jgi:hypothetical protein
VDATAGSDAADEGGGDPALVVYRVSTAQLVVAPIRFALGVALLALAVALGASRGPAGLAFAAGAFGLAFSAFADPRRRFLAAKGEPQPLPESASVEGRLALARATIFPSTVGVSILTVVALALGQGVLAALLAGALAGMGLAAALGGADLLLHERQRHVAVFADRRSRRLYERALVANLTKS